MKLINADKVIEKLKEHKSLFCKNRDEFRALPDKDKARVDEIDTCIAELVNAEEVPTTEADSDTISRAKAIVAINKALDRQTLLNRFVRKVAIDAIKQLPLAQPAQPERIIHCKDCEWWTKQECSPQGRCALSGMYPTGGWFCGNARMREVME